MKYKIGRLTTAALLKDQYANIKFFFRKYNKSIVNFLRSINLLWAFQKSPTIIRSKKSFLGDRETFHLLAIRCT